MVRLFILTLCIVALGGCGFGHGRSSTFIPTPSPKKVTTPELVRDLSQENKDLGAHLDIMRKAIDALPEADPAKAVLLADFMPLPVDWSKINVTLGDTVKSVTKDAEHTQAVEKENTALKADAPERAQLRGYGIIAVLAGCVGLAAYFFMSTVPYVGPLIAKMGTFLRDGALVLIGLGLVLITLARYLLTLESILFWTGIATLAGVLALIVVKLVKNHGQLSAILAIPPPIPKTP